jgi:hypothetical protein
MLSMDDRRASLVDGPIQIFPATFDFDIGLIQSPAGADRALPSVELLIQQGSIFDDPTIERGMVDLDAALFHHLLEFSIADRIGDIPPDTPQNHVTFETAAFEFDHLAVR